MMQNQVTILFDGYSSLDPNDDSTMHANCTCTLIRTHNGRNVIVDTLTAWDGDRLRDALATHGLQPTDINAVICTHGHSDHLGCNYLFDKAEFHMIGSSCISNRDKYYDWSAKEITQHNAADDDGCDSRVYHIFDDPNIIVERTPGHTLSCISVIIRNTSMGVVGICGDLFERREDIENSSLWLEAGSENASEQSRHRLRMAVKCSYIVPGHGPGFKVTEEMRQKLRKDYEMRQKIAE